MSEALDGSGHVTAQQLYGPYGGGRYQSGTMPTAKGYTGQYADAASSGLDYYNARYYDPLLGQFTSADTDAKGGLNRYAYVAGNPETATDPTGHRYCTSDGSSCSGHVGGGSQVTAQPDAPYKYVDSLNHFIQIFPQGSPDCGVGCAGASSHGAWVGPGKKVQSGDGSKPDEYAWGDTQNGAVASAFHGESLQNLIDMLMTMVQSMRDGNDHAKAIAGQALIAAIIEGFSLFTGGIGAAIGVGVAYFAAAEVNDLYERGADAIESMAHAFQRVYNSGGYIWTLATFWHGSVQDASLFDYYVSSGSAVPHAVLEDIGSGMAENCAQWVGSHPAPMWAGSPGVLPSQDGNYVPPPLTPGCTDVG